MGMTERAREMAEGRDPASQKRQQQEQKRQLGEDAWQREMIADLTPMITEYAQAIAKTGVRWSSSRYAGSTESCFEVALSLGRTRATSFDGDDRTASCKFRVERNGRWSWMAPPRRDDPYVNPAPLSEIEAELTKRLSWAMKSAEEQKASRRRNAWWRF